MPNIDDATARAFDDKWGATWKGKSDPVHARRTFQAFFSLFPFGELADAEGFDLGCGVGRHAAMVAPRVGKLHCIDPSPNGLECAQRLLSSLTNVEFHLAGVDEIQLVDGSQDFGYSMGVLHHVPDTERALQNCSAKLKPGAPFLLYLYYSFDNRPAWFRAVWKASDLARRLIVKLPFRAKKPLCDAIAILVYWPLSRLSLLLERIGMDVHHVPLSFYRRTPLGHLKVSALDRFGTRLERRFSRVEIERMMARAELIDVRFQEHEPYWVALGRRR
jgi:SAM-dependent methyltransferase